MNYINNLCKEILGNDYDENNYSLNVKLIDEKNKVMVKTLK
jgi:hypothetical protein